VQYRLALRLPLSLVATNKSEDLWCRWVQARVTHLQGIELSESPCDQPPSVTQTTSADPLLVFQLPRVFPPPAMTMPQHGLLSRTSLQKRRNVPDAVPQSFNEQEDWLISCETADPCEISVLVLFQNNRVFATIETRKSTALPRRTWSPSRSTCCNKRSLQRDGLLRPLCGQASHPDFKGPPLTCASS